MNTGIVACATNLPGAFDNPPSQLWNKWDSIGFAVPNVWINHDPSLGEPLAESREQALEIEQVSAVAIAGRNPDNAQVRKLIRSVTDRSGPGNEAFVWRGGVGHRLAIYPFTPSP